MYNQPLSQQLKYSNMTMKPFCTDLSSPLCLRFNENAFHTRDNILNIQILKFDFELVYPLNRFLS